MIRPQATFLQGNALDVLRAMPSGSVPCVVTSPPYLGLRDYGVRGHLWGGDPTCMHRYMVGANRKALHGPTYSRHRSSIRGSQSLQAHPNGMRNRRTVWTVTTKPFRSQISLPTSTPHRSVRDLRRWMSKFHFNELHRLHGRVQPVGGGLVYFPQGRLRFVAVPRIGLPVHVAIEDGLVLDVRTSNPAASMAV